MSGRHDGGANQQIIDLDGIMRDTVAELLEIESSKASQSVKTKKYGRLADKVKNQVREDERRDKKIALTTYKRYLTYVRNAIKGTGLTHHSLKGTRAAPGTLARAMRDYPEYSELLAPLKNEHAQTIGALKNDILKHIQGDKGNKRRSAAYSAVKAVHTDHEVLRHLYLDELTKADLSDLASVSLAEKKTGVVTIYRDDIQAIISESIPSESYSVQAFGLALASGRRAIEILHTGSFEATGDNTVMFYGQAKKQHGIDMSEYEIYTLIPAAQFVEAFEKFRASDNVVSLNNDFADLPREQRHKKINGRTAKTLNGAAKRVMDNRARAFKDSRAIYTRICTDTFFKTESKWSATDEDVFVKTLLGHGAVSTVGATESQRAGGGFGAVANYKQFKVVDGKGPAPEPEATNETPDTNTPALPVETPQAFAGADKFIEDAVTSDSAPGAIVGYHSQVIGWCAMNPGRRITFTALYKKDKGGIGGNRNTVKAYMETLAAYIDRYNASL